MQKKIFQLPQQIGGHSLPNFIYYDWAANIHFCTGQTNPLLTSLPGSIWNFLHSRSHCGHGSALRLLFLFFSPTYMLVHFFFPLSSFQLETGWVGCALQGWGVVGWRWAAVVCGELYNVKLKIIWALFNDPLLTWSCGNFIILFFNAQWNYNKIIFKKTKKNPPYLSVVYISRQSQRTPQLPIAVPDPI